MTNDPLAELNLALARASGRLAAAARSTITFQGDAESLERLRQAADAYDAALRAIIDHVGASK